MRMAVAGVAALLVCAVAYTADSPEQVLFDRVRARVAAQVVRAPRYTCVETIAREQRMAVRGVRGDSCAPVVAARDTSASSGILTWHDRLRLDVAVGENSEIFSWAGARSFESGEMGDLAVSGTTGSGDFSSFLASVFGGFAEEFRYTGEHDTSQGRLAAFEYKVPLAKSHYRYQLKTGDSGVIGYDGTFYVAPETAELKRLTVEARDFSSGEVCRVRDTMDYAQVKIGSADFLLPAVSRMVVLYRTGQETENETHYSGCREFTGESTIRFDEPDDPNTPEARAKEVTKTALKALPAGAVVRAVIEPAIDSTRAAAGDPVTARVEHDVKARGQTVVRTGDVLHGRILRLEQFLLPEPYWVVAMKFDSIERAGVEQPIRLKPLDDGSRMPPRTGRNLRMDVPPRPAGGGVFVLPGLTGLVLDRRFHTEWETN